jgi:hypothetical protein
VKKKEVFGRLAKVRFTENYCIYKKGRTVVIGFPRAKQLVRKQVAEILEVVKNI